MTEFETKELKLFKKYWETNTKYYSCKRKQAAEDAWLARAKLNETYSNISNNKPTKNSNTD